MAAYRNPTTAAHPSVWGYGFFFACRFIGYLPLAAAAPRDDVGVDSAELRKPKQFHLKPKAIRFKPNQTQRKPKQN
jgi:hypothetical protein